MNFGQQKAQCSWSLPSYDWKARCTSEAPCRNFFWLRIRQSLFSIGGMQRPNETQESSPREWSRWEASDMDGRTREGELSGKKVNQAVRHGRASPRGCSSRE